MGAQLQQKSSRGKGRRSAAPMSEINVTPFVDVMLVLLIIFMVTAPMLTVGVPVDLPKSEAPPLQSSEDPLTITVKADGTLFLQESSVDLESLVPRLSTIAGINPETRIFVRGDKNVPYGQIMAVMGLVSSAGYSKVALIAEMPSGAGAAPKPSRPTGKP